MSFYLSETTPEGCLVTRTKGGRDAEAWFWKYDQELFITYYDETVAWEAGFVVILHIQATKRRQ